MIDGLPGSGKTTFVKRICYLWAHKFNQKAGEEAFEMLEDYKLVVPILLKLIKHENTLTEILTSQLPCLNICEVCAVLKHQQKYPRDTLLLLDGYDEYTGKSFIEKVILKNESPTVLCITTSRAHAIEQIKRHSSRAVEQHVKLCGFSADQVEQYIKQFFEYHNMPPQKGTNLIKVLKEKHHLLEVAKIPIRTEMICVVWAVYGRLGDTLADLYEKFLLHLITHWYEKLPTSNQFSKLPEDKLWKSSQPLLLKVGKLANTWTKHNNLCSMYTDEELKDVLKKEDYEKVIDIGLLIKSYPSSALNVSNWSFPHLTFQEYFIAYLLGNDTNDDEITKFTKRCKQYEYRVLTKCEVIFTFLASMYPSIASKVIKQLLLEEQDKTRCEKLFDILCKQFENIVNQMTDIPLPVYLNLDSNKKINIIFLQALFDADQKRKESNLRQLCVDNPLKFEKFLDILALNELHVTILNEQHLKLVSQKVKHLRQLTCLNIKSAVDLSSRVQTDIMKNLEEIKLKYFSITGPSALEAVAKNIDKLASLEKLQVEENSDIRDKTHGQNILATLKGNKSVKQVNFGVMDLNDIIIKEDVEIKVVVRVKKLKKDTLKATSDMLRGDSTLALHTLDLSRNNLEHEGRHLGELLTKVSGLRVLILGDCNIVAKTVQEMVDVKFLGLPGLQTLNLGQCENNNCNNLHSAGSALGKLLKVMPDLQILDLAECKLQSTDFEALSQSCTAASTNIHSTTKIQTLNLCVNNLGDTSEKGFRFLQHSPELKALKAGGPDDDSIPAICGALDNGFITKLCTLDVSDSSVQSESLHILGEHLHLTKSLEVLNLKGIEEVEVADYNHIYKNIPPSLTHLNVSSEHTMINKSTDPYDILDNKYCFSKLHKLNVTLIESDQEMLQELLEKINPDIKVYCNPKENIWKIYVLDKTDT